jgi:EAL domain-containing protein (putative c-di-GMP-specific phosphodiesterase class I)
MLSADRVINILHRPKKRGVHVASGDFCAVHSSLGCLSRFLNYRLEREGSGVNRLPLDPDDALIADAVVVTRHRLALVVVVERVKRKVAPK